MEDNRSYSKISKPKSFDIVVDVDESEFDMTIEENINKQSKTVGLKGSLPLQDKIKYIEVIKNHGFISVPSDKLDTNSQVKKLFEYYKESRETNSRLCCSLFILILVNFLLTILCIAFTVYIGFFHHPNTDHS